MFSDKSKAVHNCSISQIFHHTSWAKDHVDKGRVRPADSQKQEEQVYTSLSLVIPSGLTSVCRVVSPKTL